jgi:hypothetical protein
MPKKYLKWLFVFLYGCATLQFTRYYCKSTYFYLDMPAYLSGHERLPFQERVLPILFLRPMFHSNWLMSRFAHTNGAFTPDRGPFYVVSFIALVIAALYTQKLYDLLSPRRYLNYLVFPFFLFTVIWSYSIHSEANFSYPYDLPSLAFFTAGLYYIYSRSFTGLFTVILIGTFNRETTLFLIGIYVFDSATAVFRRSELKLKRRFELKLVPWTRVALLCGIWLAIKLSLAHHFAHNDTSESFVRIEYNLRRLTPRLLPALLNICGYTIPLVLLFHRTIRPLRFANYLFILPIWFAVMFWSGVFVETRIYGELCSYSAIALILIMESSIERREQTEIEDSSTLTEPVQAAA